MGEYTNPWMGVGGSTEPNPWEKKFVGHSLASDLHELGLAALPTTEAEVQDAWRIVVKAKFGSDYDMDALKQCRDRVLDVLAQGVKPDDPRVNLQNDTTCKMCQGTGIIGTSFGRVCPSCKGTGHVRK